MLDSPLLDVILGLSVTYLILSLLCSTVLESVAGLFRLRAKDLEEGVRSLLGPGSADAEKGDAVARVFEDFFDHPLIKGLSRQGKTSFVQKKIAESRRLDAFAVARIGKRLPSYITQKAFASTLFEIVAPEDEEAGSRALAALRAKVDSLPDGTLKAEFSAMATRVTVANIRSRVLELPDNQTRADLIAALNVAGELPEVLAGVRDLVDDLPDGALKVELQTLVTPASLANIRSWIASVADVELRKQLNALLGPAQAQDLRDKIERIGNVELKKSLQAILREAGDDMSKVRHEVESWYDDAMTRVSGWYKRRSQVLLIVIGFLVVGGLNADSVTIMNALWQDNAVREVAVQQAKTASGNTNVNNLRSADQIRDNFSQLTTFGWRKRSSAYQDPRETPKGWGIVWKFFGLLLTVGAIALGADFWFNLLKKAANIRSSGAPQTTTPLNLAPASVRVET